MSAITSNQQQDRPSIELQSFMFAFAHDLRHSLRHIVTNAQLLLRTHSDLSGDVQAKLQEMVESGRQQEELIKAVMAFVDAGTSRSEARVPVSHAVEWAKISLQKKLGTSTAELKVRELPDYEVPSRLGTVLEELFTNSLKFRRADTPLVIEVDGRIDHETLALDIADNGIGIEPLFCTKVLEPFERLNSRDLYPGAGLGLSTCQRILAGHEGTLVVNAQDPPGCRITVRIPARPIAPLA